MKEESRLENYLLKEDLGESWLVLEMMVGAWPRGKLLKWNPECMPSALEAQVTAVV